MLNKQDLLGNPIGRLAMRARAAVELVSASREAVG
ncbi:MAG: hypothetical protein QOK41_826, partial [Sphingomonadales bacterium]|nr:hypothetical protein [Sphingomonadales bacterium]